jgi:hypothetical protein
MLKTAGYVFLVLAIGGFAIAWSQVPAQPTTHRSVTVDPSTAPTGPNIFAGVNGIDPNFTVFVGP